AFQSIGGSHLPYISGVPEEPRVRALMACCGISIEVDQNSLLKALHYLRKQGVQDTGLAADIYKELHVRGFPGPGNKRIMLVPGRGYIHAEDCVWKAFRAPLLQRCCRLEAVAEVYGRFGPEVREALQKWVRESPESDAMELCDALQQTILCGRASPSKPYRLLARPVVQPEEAAEGLMAASRAVIAALVEICVGQGTVEAGGQLVVPPEAESHGLVAFNHFVQHRLIVIPGSAGPDNENEVRCRLLAMGEAYWSVSPELAGHPVADCALVEHYGGDANERATEAFFTKVLRVKPVFTLQDLRRLQSVRLTRGHSPNGEIQEGLDPGLGFESPPQPEEPAAPIDPNAVLQAAFSKIQVMQPPSDTPEGEASSSSLASQQPPSRPRVWKKVGFVARAIPIFSIDGIQPPALDLSQPQVALLWHLCPYFGLHPSQLAFGYDPSGLRVSEDRLFLNLLQVPRALLLANTSGFESLVIFWSGKLASLVVRQGLGTSNAGCIEVKNHLMGLALPRILQAERGTQAGIAAAWS
ncbi:unnamed protein product, partial [Polarella glacialis]